jgi:hypothetical protein
MTGTVRSRSGSRIARSIACSVSMPSACLSRSIRTGGTKHGHDARQETIEHEELAPARERHAGFRVRPKALLQSLLECLG